MQTLEEMEEEIKREKDRARIKLFKINLADGLIPTISIKKQYRELKESLKTCSV